MRGGATWTTHRFHARCDRIVEGRVECSLQDSVLYEWRKLENKKHTERKYKAKEATGQWRIDVIYPGSSA